MSLRHFILSEVSKAIYSVQSIRNESVHGESASLKKCIDLRKNIIGIGSSGILCDLIVHKKVLNGE